MQLEKEEWNACATSGGDVNPFLLHEFFGALESSRSTCARRGWVPCHIAIREGNTSSEESGDSASAPDNSTASLASSKSSSDSASEPEETKQESTEDEMTEEEVARLKASTGRLLGVIPAYLKSHSYGEYVFDHSWANLYAQARHLLLTACLIQERTMHIITCLYRAKSELNTSHNAPQQVVYAAVHNTQVQNGSTRVVGYR